MVSATGAAHNIEVTAESLQEDLARLELQKQSLERELAAVVAHLGSVQRALSALDVLMSAPSAPLLPSGGSEPEPAGRAAVQSPAEPAPKAAADAARAPGGRRPQGQVTKRRSRASGTGSQPDQRSYGRLTEQILEYFAGVGDKDVRARDVAAALGRDTDSGSINAVRSTLDRLVGASRVRRSGRGLYRAERP
ncbi:hypothetical protein ACGF3J_31640 [Streptomyces sp. NPDC048171]|uniref:hypothetical protein n=1 Tax=unclassified Streptomyces TaxID=2593676 RepID=UPI00136A4447|nr:hypothetical protein [Streptomyces sp. SID5789]MZE73680.1 hypothetical protein [Streptomyces sp. SID5789]